MFCFSTHSLQYLSQFLKISLCKNPIRLWNILRRRKEVQMLLRQYKSFENIPYAMIRDGGEEFRVKTYYIQPEKQVEHLQKLGFKNIRIFSGTTGLELSDYKKNDLER